MLVGKPFLLDDLQEPPAEAGVNIEMMNQGASEISMMFGVKAADRDQAVRALYRTFFT